ncbi:MAG: hypothetical protein SH850_14335 [Planctomycetaceae bacterium]|nr:hypothetical protein [Planctomycetaceae bacterium]
MDDRHEINDRAVFYLTPGEVWSDAVNENIGAMRAEQQRAWVALSRHALTATAARPSGKWIKIAGKAGCWR